MPILSYNQINDLFQAITDAHYQLKRFGSGELSEADVNVFVKESTNYPMLWLTPVNVQTANNTLNYSLNLLVVDVVDKDKNNEQQVLSDNLQIALDIVRLLRYTEDEFNVVDEPVITPFAGRYGEWLAGWALEINLQVDFQLNNCDIPYDGLNLTQILQNFTGDNIGEFGCSDLTGCTTIINIQNDITTLFGNTITGGTYFSGTSTLELYNQSGGTIQITGITSGSGTQFNCDDLANCAVITGLTGDVQTIFSSITGNPTQIAYYNVNGQLTGDTNFTRDEVNNYATIINSEDQPNGLITNLSVDAGSNSRFRFIDNTNNTNVTYNLSPGQTSITVEDNNATVRSLNLLTPTQAFMSNEDLAVNEQSQVDLNSGGGEITYFDLANNLKNGYFFDRTNVGYNIERAGTQYTYFLPKQPYLAGGILTDVNGNGQLQWALPQTTGSGGGIVYYLNLSNSQTPYREFSPTPTSAAEQSSGISINNGATATIAEFLSPLGLPNVNVLPGGIWAFHLHSNKTTSNASFQIFAEVWKRSSGGTETLLFTTDSEPVLSTSPTINMQICDAYFSGCPLDVSDRILVKVNATNTSNQAHTITLYTEGGQHYSYATTTFAVLGLTCATLSGCSTIQTIQTDISNKYDKSGGTITGDVIIQSGLTANTINISTTPTLNNAPTQLLSRNSSTGRIEYTEPSQYLNEASTDQIYGSGFDGDVVLNGTNTYAAFTTKVGSAYTLTRTIYTNNLTLSNNSTLNPNGFGIYVKGTLTFSDFNSGIQSNGNNGGNANGGTAGAAGTSRAAAATNYIIMNCGGAGGVGGNTSVNAGSITVGVNYVGGIGGSGGFGYPTGNSGAGTTTTRGTVSVTAGILQQPYSNNYLSHSLYFGSVQMFAGHSGAGGQLGINGGGAVQGAGGGGGSATRGIVIFANTIDMSVGGGSGNIQSQGGNGGTGGNVASGNGTGGGGGGGGGGGFIYILTNSLLYTPNNRIRATGGLGGLGGTGSGTVNGQNVAGVRSQSGSNGVDGYIVIINPVSGTNTVYTGLY
jgi:hypothetical protein